MIFKPELLVHFPAEVVKQASSGSYSLYLSKDGKQLVAVKSMVHWEKKWKREYQPEFLYSNSNFSFEGAKWTKEGNPMEWTFLLTKEMNAIMREKLVA